MSLKCLGSAITWSWLSDWETKPVKGPNLDYECALENVNALTKVGNVFFFFITSKSRAPYLLLQIPYLITRLCYYTHLDAQRGLT